MLAHANRMIDIRIGGRGFTAAAFQRAIHEQKEVFMRRKLFRLILTAMFAGTLIFTGCGKQDIGGLQGLGVGEVYSIQEPYPAKVKVIKPSWVVLYVELPEDAIDFEIHFGEKGYKYIDSYPYVTFTDREGVRRVWAFYDNIPIHFAEGVWEVSTDTIREVRACPGSCSP